MKKLTVAIVSYNVCHYLEQCIVSVQRATRDIDCDIYVVDNDSADGTVDHLTHRFGSEIIVVDAQRNLGFARANNIAISQSESQYVLLLNPDTFVAEDSLQQVLQFMDSHPKAGGVGVRMHNSDGTLAPESRRGLPTPWVSLLKMIGFTKRYYMSHLSWDKPGQIDVMSGAFCMLRREALDKVGLLDTDFFMYGEDIDLSYRIVKGGYENWYVPADIVHYKGESTQKSSYRYVHVFYQAMLIFFRKHYSHMSVLVTLPIKAAIYMRAFLALMKMQYGQMRHSLGMARGNHDDVKYYFAGSDDMLRMCGELARRKGLTASFHHLDKPSTDRILMDKNSCLVYDTSLFTYKQIIADAYARHEKEFEIGTYASDSNMIITPSDIIK
jgi:GT2 family glycosyltransferase